MTPLPFITPADIVAYIGRGGTADATMIMAADAACDIVRDYTGQQFNRGTSTVTLDGSGGDALVLPQVPVNSAGTVTVYGNLVTDYVVDDNGILIRRAPFTGAISPWSYAQTAYLPRSWPSGRRNVTVTYDHGYADVDLPRSVRRIALEVAARTVIQGPLMQEHVGPVRVWYAAASTELTPTERLILDTYRRR